VSLFHTGYILWNLNIIFNRKYAELIKSQDMECILRIESCGVQLMDLFCEIFRLVCLDQASVSHSADSAKSVARAVRAKLADFIGFLKVKAMRNFTLGSYPFHQFNDLRSQYFMFGYLICMYVFLKICFLNSFTQEQHFQLISIWKNSQAWFIFSTLTAQIIE